MNVVNADVVKEEKLSVETSGIFPITVFSVVLTDIFRQLVAMHAVKTAKHVPILRTVHHAKMDITVGR